MKHMRKMICLLLAIAMIFGMIPMSADTVEAATTSSYSPYAGIEYSYSSSVSCGTIRYMSQVTSDSYFNWSYWPTSSFGGYASPGSECGTASISMALSYIGIDQTPKAMLEAYNGYTQFIGWGGSTHTSLSASAISTAMSNYINGNGKYSPPVIHIPGYSSDGHYVVVIGQISSNTYQILDPWERQVTSMTISGTSASYSKDGTTINDTIDQLHQWYNASASITTNATEPTISGLSIPKGLLIGTDYTISGEITSTQPIVWVWVGVKNMSGDHTSVTTECNPHETTFDLSQLASQLDFSSLQSYGFYRLQVHVISGGNYYVVYDQEFAVVDVALENFAMPDLIVEGQECIPTGVLQSKCEIGINWVHVGVKNDAGWVLEAESNPWELTYDISELTSQLDFASLSSGEYTFQIDLICSDVYIAPTSISFEVGIWGKDDTYVNPFSDVSDSAWYASSVQYVNEKGLMSGNSGLFNPTGNVTRAQLVSTLYKLAGSPTVTDYSACDELIDVKKDMWYTNAVCWAYSVGVASGNTSTKMFNMGNSVTRQQLATFFYNYAEYKGLDITTRGDISGMVGADEVSSYALDTMQWAVGTGLISGSASTGADGTTVYKLNPKGTATRAQLAAILQKFCENNLRV